jgi:hypothetical protein
MRREAPATSNALDAGADIHVAPNLVRNPQRNGRAVHDIPGQTRVGASLHMIDFMRAQTHP